MQMLSLLHLSDLHFGEILDPPYEHILSTREGAKELADIFYEHYNDSDIPDPNGIVITGDLTSTAESGEFDYVESFIKRILEIFSLNESAILVVPGNHDVSWSAKKLDRPEKYASFRHFYKILFNDDWSHLDPKHIVIDIPDEDSKCVIFGFNSCSVEDQYWRGMGYIHKDQFKIFDDFFKENEDNFAIKLAALHHHVMPVHNYHPSFKKFNPRDELDDEKNPPPISLLLNASQLLKKCRKNRIHGILHGHSHAPYSVTQTNYIDLDFNDKNHIPRSIAIIGCGSPTSKNIEEYKKNHYQHINFKRSSKRTFFINLLSYRSTEHQPNVTDMVLSHPITLPGGKDELIISDESLGVLRQTLNKIVVNSYSFSLNSSDEDINFLSHKLYDDILATTVNWLEASSNANYGSAIISRFIPDLKVYKHIAVYRYKEEVRHFAYHLDERSITTECGKSCESLNIRSRNNSQKASRKRDSIYKETLMGDDQTCVAVPLNSAGAIKNAYAVLHFAKGKMSTNDKYSEHDLRIIEKIAVILEDALRQAEIADIAEKRRLLIMLFNKLRKLRKNQNLLINLRSLFDHIVDEIFNHLGLHKNHRDAVGIFFPLTIASNAAKCLAHRGFDENAENMSYALNERRGLTGAVLDLRKSDYCVNHLAEGFKNRSVILNSVTSAQCTKNSETIMDHHLSWVGVPLGKGTAP